MPGILWGWVVTTMFTRPGQPVVASSTFQVGPPVGLGLPSTQLRCHPTFAEPITPFTMTSRGSRHASHERSLSLRWQQKIQSCLEGSLLTTCLHVFTLTLSHDLNKNLTSTANWAPSHPSTPGTLGQSIFPTMPDQKRPCLNKMGRFSLCVCSRWKTFISWIW